MDTVNKFKNLVDDLQWAQGLRKTEKFTLYFKIKNYGIEILTMFYSHHEDLSSTTISFVENELTRLYGRSYVDSLVNRLKTETVEFEV